MPRKPKFPPNTINQGDGLELLKSLSANLVKLVFFDPQYEKANKVTWTNYPCRFQSDNQISQFCQEIERILKLSALLIMSE